MSKHIKIAAFILCIMTTSAFYGQRVNRDKIKTLKVAFITERLNLTSQEAQVFWPIYNEHEDDIGDLRKREREDIRSKLRDFDSLSEDEAAQLLKELIALEKMKHELNSAYFNKLSEVISPKKTFKLIKAEDDFKKRLLREIQQRRGGGRQ